MNNDELNLIKNITKEKIAISKFQEESFMKRKVKNSKEFWIKTIATSAACITLFSGIIFSKDISKQIYALYNQRNIVEVATSNAHNAKFDSEYEVSQSEIIDLNNNNQNISQDAIKIKVEEITMDDTSLDIIFDVSFGSEIASNIDEKSYLEINLPNISITDEEGNIIYCSDKNKIYELLGIDLNTKEGASDYYNEGYLQNDKYFNSDLTSYVCGNKASSAKLFFNLTLFEQDRYLPRAKTLNINFSNIQIKSGNKVTLNFKGEWNINLTLPENVYSRARNVYKEVEENSSENKILTFNVLSTWTETTLQLKANEIDKGAGSPQLNLINAIEVGEPTTQIRDYFVDGLMASDEYKKYEDDLMKNYLIQDAYIEDANGNTYGLVKGTFSNAGGSIDDDWNYKPKLVLDFKDVNMTDTLKLHVTYLDNEYVFDLVKEGEV